MTLQLVFLLIAFICFILGAAQVTAKINFVGLGLAFWILTLIVK